MRLLTLFTTFIATASSSLGLNAPKYAQDHTSTPRVEVTSYTADGNTNDTYRFVQKRKDWFSDAYLQALVQTTPTSNSYSHVVTFIQYTASDDNIYKVNVNHNAMSTTAYMDNAIQEFCEEQADLNGAIGYIDTMLIHFGSSYTATTGNTNFQMARFFFVSTDAFFLRDWAIQYDTFYTQFDIAPVSLSFDYGEDYYSCHMYDEEVSDDLWVDFYKTNYNNPMSYYLNEQLDLGTNYLFMPNGYRSSFGISGGKQGLLNWIANETLYSVNIVNGHTDNDYGIYFRNGYDQGYNDGKQEGLNQGYATGYEQGTTHGISVANDYSFFSLFGAIADTPVLMIRNLFNFDFFGINLLTVVLSLFTGLILFYLFRKLI